MQASTLFKAAAVALGLEHCNNNDEATADIDDTPRHFGTSRRQLVSTHQEEDSQECQSASYPREQRKFNWIFGRLH